MDRRLCRPGSRPRPRARTLGMANLFKQVCIYSSVGQRCVPENIGSVLSYREALDGQIMEEGISETGAIASWSELAREGRVLRCGATLVWMWSVS